MAERLPEAGTLGDVIISGSDGQWRRVEMPPTTLRAGDTLRFSHDQDGHVGRYHVSTPWRVRVARFFNRFRRLT